ncbi:ABC transporter permease [Kistimonas scapharcae]|uniref:ABC transporter permease n=1 Tax=Kistimonas scapharcae TaxID=1036133 RepID=A0ABP8V5T2_9GAMM
MDIDLLTSILFAMVRTGTPLLLVALGEMVCEKSGVLNLGQEGMMLMGAVAGFMGAVTTGSLTLGVLIGMTAGVAMALLFGLVALNLRANQVATGLALTIIGTGLSAWIGGDYVGRALTGIQPMVIPWLSEIPVIGKALFTQDPLVYVSLILTLLAWCFFRFTHAGLTTLAVGENPHSATAVGLPVMPVRYLAVLFGGAMAGLGGAYLSLAYTPLWTENMTAGRGWIALALVVFASWRVGRIILGAWLFGAASILHLVLQGTGVSVSSNLLATLPYVATIVVLVLLSQNPPVPA